MKRAKISINGQAIADVRIPSRAHPPTRTRMVFGYPDVFVREEDGGLSVELHPMTVAQLYFDGVLPQDRSMPVEVKLGRKKPSLWRIDEMVMQKDRWGRDGLVLRLVPA